MRRSFFSLLLLGCLLGGCTVKPALPFPEQTQRLSETLQALDHRIPADESVRLSHDLYGYTSVLVHRYRLTRPPLWHNFLVNIGLREKGLCYDFSDALYLHLKQGAYPHFDFHLAVAHRGEYFREHNALVITGKGRSVEEGVIVDDWRHSGRLFYTFFRNDPEYRWHHRAERCCQKGR
jgi:hypothetical protein